MIHQAVKEFTYSVTVICKLFFNFYKLFHKINIIVMEYLLYYYLICWTLGLSNKIVRFLQTSEYKQ